VSIDLDDKRADGEPWRNWLARHISERLCSFTYDGEQPLEIKTQVFRSLMDAGRCNSARLVIGEESYDVEWAGGSVDVRFDMSGDSTRARLSLSPFSIRHVRRCAA
jgi:hypothetical protein